MNARFYVPGIARFASADTIVPNPTNPQSLNRYTYVRNSPLNLVDPTGHRDCEFDGYCGPPVSSRPWANAKRQYEAGDDLVFAPQGSNGVERYEEFSLFSGHIVVDPQSGDIIDTFLELGWSGYWGLGVGVNLQASFAEPHFIRGFEFESGKGLGGDISDVGLEAKKIISWSGDGKSIEYSATLGIVSGATGVAFDPAAVIVRPTGQFAKDLANGSNTAWKDLWVALYDPQPLPPGIQGPSSVFLHPDFMFSNVVPPSSIFSDYGGFLPIYPIGY